MRVVENERRIQMTNSWREQKLVWTMVKPKVSDRQNTFSNKCCDDRFLYLKDNAAGRKEQKGLQWGSNGGNRRASCFRDRKAVLLALCEDPERLRLKSKPRGWSVVQIKTIFTTIASKQDARIFLGKKGGWKR